MEMRSRTRKPRFRLPGDPSRSELIKRIIRVDHAGEFGAAQIYTGQLRILDKTPFGPPIREMAETEAAHLQTFEQLMLKHRVRPTVLMPLWKVAGLTLGMVTARLGAHASMACTVAIEDVIDGHYTRQIESLGDEDITLIDTLKNIRDEEREHREIAKSHGAEKTVGYRPMTFAIKVASKVAIWLSERI